MKHIVVVGSPVDGFTFYGPFETEEDALRYAENVHGDSWWIALLYEADAS